MFIAHSGARSSKGGESVPRVFAFLFFFLVITGLGAETLTLSLEDAIQFALDQSINLRKNSIDLEQARYAADHLWSEIFPGFSLSTGFNLIPDNTRLFSDPGFVYNSDSLRLSFTLGLSLQLNMSLKASMDRIRLAYSTQLLSFENAARLLEIQVTRNYLNLITLKANAALMEENLALAELRLERDRLARATGIISELNLLNSQLNLETARLNLVNARGSYQNSLGDFLALLGLRHDLEINFTDTVEIAPVTSSAEELIFQYLPQRPDIVSQRQIIQRLELTEKINRISARVPSLSLSATYRGNITPANTSSPFGDSISSSLTLNIPIDSWIPGTRQNQSLRRDSADVEKAKLDLQNTETAAQNQIRSLVLNLNNSLASLEIARLRLQIAERTVEATEIGFRQGAIESKELEDSRASLSDSKQRLLQSEYNCQFLLLDLASALNTDVKTLTGR